MKLDQYIAKSSKAAAVLMLILGFIFMAASVPFPNWSGLFCLALTVTGSLLVFLIVGGLSNKITPQINKLLHNSQQVLTDPNASIDKLTRSPLEIKNLNENFLKLRAMIQDAIKELENNNDRHKHDLELIKDILETAHSDRQISYKMADISKKIISCCGAKGSLLFLKDYYIDIFKLRTLPEEDKPAFDCIIKGEGGYQPFIDVMKSRVPEFIPNASDRKDLASEAADWAADKKASVFYCISIFTDNDPAGLLVFALDEVKEFSRGQNTVLRTAADIIGLLYGEETRRQKDAETISILMGESKVTEKLLEINRIDKIGEQILPIMANYLPIDCGGVAFYQKEKNSYSMKLLKLSEENPDAKTVLIPYEDSGIAWVRENKKVWLENDLNTGKTFIEDDIFLMEGICSRIIVPLYIGSDFVGALIAASLEKNAFQDQEVFHINKTARWITKSLSRVFEEKIEDKKENKDIQALQTSNQALKKFFINFGHELRNPLNTLHRLSYMAREQNEKLTPRQIKEAFHFISKNTQKLYKSIEDVLDYSRAEAGKLDFNPSGFYISTSLKTTIDELQEEAEAKSINMKWDFPRGMPEIMADEDKLKAIVKELAYNAVKHTSEGGSITIKVNMIPKTWLKEKAFEFFPKNIAENMDMEIDHLLISITDTGAGIPVDKQRSLFKPSHEDAEKFEQGETQIKMGLPKIKRFVDIHNGFIWVASKEGRGSRFCFNIPQYGKNWADLRNKLQDMINTSRSSLECLTVISIKPLKSSELKDKLQSKYGSLIKEIEDTVKSKLRGDGDFAQKYLDEETVIAVTKADIDEAEAIKNRLYQALDSMPSTLTYGKVEYNLESITYPDEVLTADDLMSRLDGIIKGKTQKQ